MQNTKPSTKPLNVDDKTLDKMIKAVLTEADVRGKALEGTTKEQREQTFS